MRRRTKPLSAAVATLSANNTSDITTATQMRVLGYTTAHVQQRPTTAAQTIAKAMSQARSQVNRTQAVRFPPQLRARALGDAVNTSSTMSKHRPVGSSSSSSRELRSVTHMWTSRCLARTAQKSLT
jgi:hypothetical protein